MDNNGWKWIIIDQKGLKLDIFYTLVTKELCLEVERPQLYKDLICTKGGKRKQITQVQISGILES